MEKQTAEGDAKLTDNLTVGLSPSSYDPAFGQSGDTSIRAKIVQLIASVRTLMRSTCCLSAYVIHLKGWFHVEIPESNC